jgi:hypothetical protein
MSKHTNLTGGSTIGKVRANGTDTATIGEANTGMTGNTVQTSAMQTAVALGAGKSSIGGYQQNAISVVCLLLQIPIQ